MFISHSVLRTPSSPLLVQYSKKFEVSRPPTFPTTQKRKKGNEFSNPPFFSHVWTLKNKRGRFPPSSSSSSFWVLGVQINFLTVCDDTSLVPSLKSRWAATREQHSEPVFLCCCPTKPSPKKKFIFTPGKICTVYHVGSHELLETISFWCWKMVSSEGFYPLYFFHSTVRPSYA